MARSPSEGAASGGLGGFCGNERFELKRPLGEGGYGTVYAALDRATGGEVALKVLKRMSPDALFRFKREFRAIADLSHPNLVRLGELSESEGHWMFSMELVQGTDLLDYVCPRASVRSDAHRCDLLRLQSAMTQLVEALHALHENGHIHCDVKPSNVKVTPEGRAVLLDFGLVKMGPDQADSTEADLLGTVAYMAPEQCAGRRLSPAADYYALGTMLYEALSGWLPFDGGSMQILIDKQREDPPHLRTRCPDAPAELDELCAALLDRNPIARPGRDEVIASLSGGPHTGVYARRDRSLQAVKPRRHVFLGRRRELDTLHHAFRSVQQRGHMVGAYVYGDSGLGKTALIEAFTREAIDRVPGLLVLYGRCYERETVPYKAFDGVVDNLARFLRKRDPELVASLLPRHAAALGLVFPVLGSVQGIAKAQLSERQGPLQQAQAARHALRDLLLRVADTYPLLVVIDDIHWTDTESLQLLADLSDTRHAPNMMLVATGRPLRALPNEVAHALEHLLRQDEDSVDLQLLGLPPSEAEQLTRYLLGAEAATASVGRIAAESEGHPLFIDLLVRYWREHGDPAQGKSISLDAALLHYIQALSAPARQLLQLLAVASAPVTRLIATDALGVPPSQFAQHLAELRALRFIKQHSRVRGEMLETFHDRVLQATLDDLGDDAERRLHAMLARALSASEAADHEAIALHWREAGDAALARRYAASAAEHARHKLAFEKAARLYRQLSIDAPANELSELLRNLGEVLALAGHSPEAADAYVQALVHAAPSDTTELRRRAAEHLLRSGRFDEGRRVGQQLLDATELRMPSTPLGALWSRVWHSIRKSWQGLDFHPRSAESIPMSTLSDIDTLWSLAPLASLDFVRGAALTAAHLRAALHAGEPARAQRAITVEGFYRWPAPPEKRAERDLQARLHALTRGEDTCSEHVRAMAHAALAQRLLMVGEVPRAHDHAVEAEALFLERCTGVRWELVNVRTHLFSCASLTGRYLELRQRLPGLVQEARELGDRYAVGHFQVAAGWLVPLSEGDITGALAALDEGMAVWPETAVMQRVTGHLQRCRIYVQADEPERALTLLDAQWPEWKAHVLRLPVTRGYAWLVRGASLLAAAPRHETLRGRDELLEQARRALTKACRSPVRWIGPSAWGKLGCLDALLGEPKAALEKLAAAESQLRELRMSSAALAMRRAQWLISRPMHARAAMAPVDDAFHEAGLRVPEHYYRSYCPGLQDWE